MKYMKGKNLELLCQEQPEQHFSVDTALAMMTPIVEALIYLHQQEPPIVHRNVNPANIIVPPDETEAILVGFSTTKEHSAMAPSVAFRHESPGYAAIEQFGEGCGIDLRTDVYGLGATFYTLLTGVTPVDTISRVTMEQGSDPLKPISIWVPTIPLPVTSAVERAMALHKKDRFATVEEFWQAMRSNAKEQLQQNEFPPVEVLLSPAIVDQAAESVVAEPLPIQPEEDESPSEEIAPLPAIVDQAAESVVAESLPIQPEEDESLLLEVPLFSTIVNQAAENIAAEPLPVQREPKPGRKRSRVRFLVLALTLLLGLGLSCFVYVVGYAYHVPPAHKLTPAPTPTSIANATPYPPLASSYVGTVSNISVPKTTTKLYLRDIQQDQNGLQGSFEGLGMAGPFTGTVTPSGKVLFKVKVRSSTTMLIFDGAVASSGSLEGTFNAVDQHGRNTGQYGLWYASVSSTLQDSSPPPATQTPAPATQTPAPATQTLSASGGQNPVNKHNAHTKGAAQPRHVHRTAEPSDDVPPPTPGVSTTQPSKGAPPPTPGVGKAKPPCNLNLILLCL